MLLELAFVASLLCEVTWCSEPGDLQLRYASGTIENEEQGITYLKEHDLLASEECYQRVVAEWTYATNITDHNKKTLLEVIAKGAIFEKEAWKNATSFAWKNFKDPTVKRWFKQLSILGNPALPEDELKELNTLIADMTDIYSTAKICPYNLKDEEKTKENCKLNLEPEMKRILKKSQDYEELKHVWKSFRDASGKKLKSKYLRYVELLNRAAKLNGFPNAGELWREPYESDTFLKDLDDLWNQMKPLYEQLHAYARKKLIEKYGNNYIRPDGPIPAHLLGSMWAQSWENIQNYTLPYPGQPSVDVTNAIVAKNMTALDIFKLSDEFFTSLGLKPMPKEFWDHSVLEKPKDREIVCHASAWDFCNGKDFRVKQCTDTNMQDMITAHHEMGHIEYFLQYAHQPLVFRNGANPGFHEAIGDVLALSVSTPAHLKKIGLLEKIPEGKEGDINFLYSVALKKLAFQPSGYLIDLWRWKIFSGEYKPEEMNRKWWELRLKYQGLCPPVRRTEEDFDPGAKFHVPADTPYIRYFVSTVVQYQFYKALCDAANHTGPLYTCDIYQSKEAGKLFSEAMKIGSSQPWTEVMKVITRGKTDKMDAQPILDYFAPLIEWLKEQNKDQVIGWKSTDPTICP